MLPFDTHPHANRRRTVASRRARDQETNSEITPYVNLSKGKVIDMQPDTERDTPDAAAPEDQPNEPGAEGGSQSDAKDKLPGAPADDDSPLGDTDQHSNA